MLDLGSSVAKRVGIWALIQALPNESTLKEYLRAAYLGLAGVIVGSVMCGAALAASMVALYGLLTSQGTTPELALGVTAAISVLVTIICFIFGISWFKQLSTIKQDTSFLPGAGDNMISAAINSIAEGFIEGLVLTPEQTQENKQYNQK